MAITQTIATLPVVLNDSSTFYEDIAERNNSLVTTVLPSINTWATQANALAVEVNDKAEQVAAQAVDGGYSQNYINSNFFSQDYINDNFVNQDINTLTNKTTPVDADELFIADSDSSFSLKKLSFNNLKANLLTYFDTLYSRTSAIFGVDQTWQNATGSRLIGVTYTNPYNKPIYAIIYGNSPVASIQINVTINEISFPLGLTDSLSFGGFSFMVPALATYKITTLTSTFTVATWCELK